jgi:hypothetical protein
MYYFAYALNLSKKQMLARCPDSKPVYTAVLPNYKLAFVDWSRQWKGGIATIKSFRGEKVRGAIYDVSDACLRQIEKHDVGFSRLNVTVFNEDNEPVQAVTYIKTGQLEETAPSKEYGEILRQGYRDWGIA